MERYLNRKGVLSTLGVAGLGLSLMVTAAGGAPTAIAVAKSTTPSVNDARQHAQPGEMRAQFYSDFTAALGDQLGVSDPAKVDTAIRNALATVVDGFQRDKLLTPGKAEAVKALLTTLDAPVKPGPMFGPRMEMVLERAQAGAAPGNQGAASSSEAAPTTEGPATMAQRFYPEFTAALAKELGSDADKVDGAIRLAMMAVIDKRESGQTQIAVSAEVLKSMVATADSPLSPGLVFGPPPGMVMQALHGRRGDGGRFPGMGEGEDWTIPIAGGAETEQRNASDARENENGGNHDNQANDENEANASS